MPVSTPAIRPPARAGARFPAIETITPRLRSALTPPFSLRTVGVLLALYILLATNWPLWLALVRQGGAWHVVASGVVGMACLTFAGLLAVVALTAWARPVKWLWVALLALAAALQYFMLAYGVVIDPTMAANALHTDAGEARDQLGLPLAAATVLLTAPAAWWVSRVAIAPERPLARLARNARLLALAVGLAALALAATSRTVAPLMRNQPQLRYLVNPLAALYSTGRALAAPLRASAQPITPISAGARLAPAAAGGGTRPPLLLLVVGETARADHFALNGYARPTTPELAARGVLSFTDVRSCGTNTLASVPCMFSHLGKEAFEARKGDSENLLDVLQAAGLAVLWIDNQPGGCKGVCARVPTARMGDAASPAAKAHWCAVGECLDDVMLEGLDARLAALDPARAARGVVLVMHQMGSHGPAYFRRSAPAQKRFLPECTTTTLADCKPAELINAYDNSIAGTDHFLASAIDWLKAQDGRYATGLLYVSDHGESLGEFGLYLHGMPYRMAPDVQKHVPMVAWLGGGLGARSGVADACARAQTGARLTHDNLYPTVLGLAGVETPTYRRALDIFAACRGAPGA